MTVPPGHSPVASDAAVEPRPAPAGPPRQRWRLYLAIPAASSAAASAEQPRGGRPWPAILAASGLPVAGEGAARGRAVVAVPLPLGVAGEREIVDLYLSERVPVADAREVLARALPAGWSLVDLHDVWVGAASASSAVVAADYRAVVAGAPPGEVEAAARAILAAATLPRAGRRERQATGYDLRVLLLALEVRAADASGVTLAMRLRHGPGGSGRPEEVVAALGEPPARPLAAPLVVRSIVRERLVLADDSDAPPSPPA